MKKSNHTSFVSVKSAFFAVLLSLVACATDAQFDADDVCPVEGLNVYGFANRGTFTDPRDGQEYAYTTIGKQVWMAQNLNYPTGYSMKNDSMWDCALCGLWYKFSALSLDSIASLCPPGWRVPTEEDWLTLFSAVGASNVDETLVSERIGGEPFGANLCGYSGIAAGWITGGNEHLRSDSWLWWSQTLDGCYLYADFGRDAKLAEMSWVYFRSHLPVRCMMDL